MSVATKMSHEEGGDVCLLLDALSNELLLHVLGFLELAPDLNRVSMACRTLNELAHAPTLWRCVRFPRLAPLITPPQHRIASLQAAGGAGDEDDAPVLRSKDQQSQRDSKQDVQVFPDLLLQHVVARHNKDVREIDLSLVPFNQATCRMKAHQMGQLLRDVFVRCTRLERFLCPQLFRAEQAYLSKDNAELFTTWPELGHEAPQLRVLDLSGWRIPNMLDIVESFPNVETLALACAQIESASGEAYFSPIQELRSLTNLKHLDISYVAKDKSDESLATKLNLKTLISIQETGLYGNRRTRPPQHRDAMDEGPIDSCRIIQTDIFAQGGLDDQSLVSSVTNPACFDLAGRTLLHRAADDPKRIMQLRQLVDESGHVDAPLAAGLDKAVGITHIYIRYNRFIHGAKRSVSDRLGGLSFPSPVTSARRDQVQTRPMLLTPQSEAPGSTALHIACANDNQEAVAYLLAKGADVNSVNDTGQTPLMLACHFGNLPAVSALIATGRVTIGLQDNQGRTALHYAALGCPRTDSVSASQALPRLAEQLFELLFSAGSDVNQPNGNGFSALHLACMARNSALVVYLLSRGASVSVGISPLFCLTGDGELSVFGTQSGDVGVLVDVLVAAGCPVNAVNETGKTLLHVACQDRDADLAEALLRHADVDVNLADAVGWTPLHAVACQVLSARAAAENAPRAGSLFPAQGRASASSSIYAMDYRHNSTVFGTSSSGSTSAMFGPPRAAPPPSPPRPDLAPLLLNRQANVNATTIDGQSPLLVAAITSVKEVDGRQSMHPMQASIVQEENKEIGKVVPFMRKLIESGADVNAQDSRGWTALHAVCASGHLEAVGLLLSHGANVNARDFKSVTPLIAAARGVLQHGAANNSVPGLRAPLPAGRSEAPSQRREQPPAPQADSLTICKLLLSHGAQFDVVDEVDGETALHLLTRAATGPLNGMLDWAVVQLKDHGIFHLRNAKGKTLLHTAIACNNAKLVSTLLQHGADKSLRSHLGETALHTALRLQSATRTTRLSTQPSESRNSAVWPSSARISLHQVHERAGFNSWGYPMWHVEEARNSAKSGLPPDPLINDRVMPRNVTAAGRTNTPTSEHILMALVARGLTEEECTAKDCFGLTVLHWAAALGANAPRPTQDKGLSRLAVLSLFIVNHILAHFKDRVMDAVDERGDTALHKLAEMRQVTFLMAASQTSHVAINTPRRISHLNPPGAGSDADFDDDVFLREAYGELTAAASQIEQRLISREGTTTTAEKPLRKRRTSPEAAADAVVELPSASKRKKKRNQYEDDEEEMEMEMEIESALPEPEPEPAAAATNCPTSKNAAAADGTPGMLTLCGDAIALLLLQAGASCTIQNRRGETPLHVACRRSVTPLIATLLSYAPGDVNAVNRDGDTALHLLLGSSYAPEVLARAAPTSEARALWDSALASLLAAGADVSKCNGIGQNALHMACRANLVVVVRQLLGRPGVDVNAPELGTGLTPLMLALRNAQPEPAALVLLRHGADATLRDALGRSAEDWAGPQLWASLLRQAALAPDSIDDKDDNDDQWDSSVEGVDQHRATGLLSSAPRPRPGAISLVAREAKGLRLLQQAKANRPRQSTQPATGAFVQQHGFSPNPYMGFTSAADH